jgi:hypothetical protein
MQKPQSEDCGIAEKRDFKINLRLLVGEFSTLSRQLTVCIFWRF